MRQPANLGRTGAQQVLEQRPSCSLAIELLADIYAAQARLAQAARELDMARVAAANGEHCFRALEVSDPIRGRYWQQRQRELLEYAKPYGMHACK
jgi:hypothetical protein